MNQKAINIINWLADDGDYFTGISVLQTNGRPPRGIMQTITRKENPYNRAKLIYLLIKDLNDLIGKKEFTEQNYKQKVLQYKNVKLQVEIVVDNKKLSGISDNISLELNEFLPKELSDKEYAKWFYEQPKKIQELIKEQSRLTRERAKLHNECRKIKGNSEESKKQRLPILLEIDEISGAIKNIYAIVENFKASGEISAISTTETVETKDDFDFSGLSDLDKKKELDNLVISIGRNRKDFKKLKLKTSKRGMKLKALIDKKEKQIKILKDWYASVTK